MSPPPWSAARRRAGEWARGVGGRGALGPAAAPSCSASRGRKWKPELQSPGSAFCSRPAAFAPSHRPGQRNPPPGASRSPTRPGRRESREAVRSVSGTARRRRDPLSGALIAPGPQHPGAHTLAPQAARGPLSSRLLFVHIVLEMARLSGQNGESCRDLSTSPDCRTCEWEAKWKQRPDPCGGKGKHPFGGVGEGEPQ